MKVIFLDFDGVLNSSRYDSDRDLSKCEFLDATRIKLVKQIVDATGAKIVLSTTWKNYWDKDSRLRTRDGEYIDSIFKSEGLSIFDKTPSVINNRRAEIEKWINNCGCDVESFVILDDTNFGWEDYSDFWVKTSFYIGYGLEQDHVDKSIKILLKQV